MCTRCHNWTSRDLLEIMWPEPAAVKPCTIDEVLGAMKNLEGCHWEYEVKTKFKSTLVGASADVP